MRQNHRSTPDYRLSPGAARDLKQIFEYTARSWGHQQLESYAATFERRLEDFAKARLITSSPLPQRPELKSFRCEKHYVFSLQRDKDVPLIIAVLHEKRDLMARLANRLDEQEAK